MLADRRLEFGWQASALVRDRGKHVEKIAGRARQPVEPRSIHFWCKPLPKVDIMPADPGEKGPLSTGEEPWGGGGSKRVASADGYFISAMKILKDRPVDKGSIHIRIVHTWSKPFPKMQF
jgi:hypothetical protein